MRIKTRIAVAAGQALTRLPFPRYDLKECLKPDGKTLDAAKAMAAFTPRLGDDFRSFTPASSDNVNVWFAAFVFLEQFHSAYQQVIDDPTNGAHEAAATRADVRLENRMEKDRCVFANCDIRATAGGAKVRLWWDNPFNVVGGAEVEARMFTVTCCQLWQHVVRQLGWVTLDAPADVIADAETKNREAADRREYGECERRRNGYCSPCKFDCKFYLNGKCRFGM